MSQMANIVRQSDTLAVPSCPSSMPSTTANTSTSFYRDMSKVQAIWLKVTPVLPASRALSL